MGGAGGFGLPGNMSTGFGGFSTLGAGGPAPTQYANTTAAVTGADGSLKAYDPNTMSMQTRAAATAPPAFGFKGSEDTTTSIANDLQSEKGMLIKAPKAVMNPSRTVKTTTPTTTTTTPTTTTPAAATNPAIKPLTLPTYAPGPQYVNDQWNFQGGTSLPIASGPAGSGPTAQNNPLNALIPPGGGVMPQFFSNGSGQFFYDAAGKQAVPTTVANILKQVGMK